METVGSRLRYARKCRGYRVGLVCKYTRISRHVFAHYEKGETWIPLEVVQVLAYLYEVPAAWVLHGGEAPCQPRRQLPGWERGGVLRDAERRFNALCRACPGPIELSRRA